MAYGTTFAVLLHQHRRAGEWTQEALAERSTVSVEAISALERGVRRKPRRATAELLADALGLELDTRRQFMEVACSIVEDPTARCICVRLRSSGRCQVESDGERGDALASAFIRAVTEMSPTDIAAAALSALHVLASSVSETNRDRPARPRPAA